jgi:hypothetical protein
MNPLLTAIVVLTPVLVVLGNVVLWVSIDRLRDEREEREKSDAPLAAEASVSNGGAPCGHCNGRGCDACEGNQAREGSGR